MDMTFSLMILMIIKDVIIFIFSMAGFSFFRPNLSVMMKSMLIGMFVSDIAMIFMVMLIE